MTDQTPKPRTRNATSSLGAGVAFDRLTIRLDTKAARRAEALKVAADAFDAAEDEFNMKVAGRVPEDQKARLLALLRALPEAEELAERILMSEILEDREVAAERLAAELDAIPVSSRPAETEADDLGEESPPSRIAEADDVRPSWLDEVPAATGSPIVEVDRATGRAVRR